jgi:UPF0755 protein
MNQKSSTKRRNSSSRGKLSGRRWRVAFMALVAVILVGAATAWWLGAKVWNKYDGEKPVRIYLPEGSDAQTLADTLSVRLGAFGKDVYSLWKLRCGDEDRLHGSYVIKPGDRAWSVTNRLRTGTQTPVKVTFNNVRTLGELADIVSRHLEFDSTSFMLAMDTVLHHRHLHRAEYPAAFLPDTYEFYWTATPHHVVSKMLEVRDEFWDSLRLAKADNLFLTPVQITTIASIVEEETAKKDERPLVARLYINRLNNNMKLQADPTVKFAVGDFSLKRITGKQLAVNSPYNTYKYFGLPPGPIRIPERATIDAVLDAPEHDWLYMCAKEDFSGYHNFATNFSEHQANARRYQSELNRLNIN